MNAFKLFTLTALVLSMLFQGNFASADGPKTIRVGNLDLQHNGSGFRKKTLLTLYEGSLYLGQRSNTAASIIAADQPMAIRLRITSGFVSQEKMIAALSDGFENATNGKTSAISREIEQFRGCFGDSISKNDVFVISYLPGKGVQVDKNGERKGVIAGLAFKQALFGIWLSDRPADKNLRTAMLGQ